MSFLSLESFMGMLRRCEDFPGYRGVILFETAYQRRRFADDFEHIEMHSNELEYGQHFNKQYNLKFKNGSIIQAIVGAIPANRRSEYDEIIFDKDCKTETMNKFDSESHGVAALDSFLSEFVVV